jgi:hypothetical protein
LSLPPLPVSPVLSGSIDISLLRSFIAATKQYSDYFALPPDVDAISSADVNSQFQGALADRCVISQIAGFQLTNPRENAGLRNLISQ